jgi:hypothetical protein
MGLVTVRDGLLLAVQCRQHHESANAKNPPALPVHETYFGVR